MPLEYVNTESPNYSEAVSVAGVLEADWVSGDPDTLSLFVLGSPLPFEEDGLGTMTVSGAGIDIWEDSDECRFVYKTLNGNGSIVAKVESLQQTHDWAKGGVMIRDNLSPGSMNAFTCMTPTQGVVGQRRIMTSDASESVFTGNGDPQVLHWVRISRKDNVFTSEHSADGSTWEAINSPVEIMMQTQVFIGFALTSHAENVTGVAEFSNISITGQVNGAWQSEDIGVDMSTGNDAEDLYIVVTDDQGKTAKISYDDPLITQQSQWTEWAIPLAEIESQGVDLNSIANLTIGLGPDRSGDGLIFIDDISLQRSVSQ